MTYLVLEGKAHHREHLAELLWDNPNAHGNLRVELARLKQQYAQLFPARQSLLSLACETDLERLLRLAPQISAQELSEWLSMLRGPPLSGLEDLGSLKFRAWVDQRKSQINDQLERVLTQVYRRFERLGQKQAAELVLARADLLGLGLIEDGELSARPVGSSGPAQLQFQWPDTVEAFRTVFQQAHAAPQLVLFRGHSDAQRAVLRAAVAGTPWKVIQLQGSVQPKLLRAALIQHLSRLVSPERAAALPPSLHSDGDLVQMAELLERVAGPVVIAVHDAAAANDWVSNGVRFALDLPLPLVLVLSTPLRRSPRALYSALGQVDWARTHYISMAPLGIQGVLQALDWAGEVHPNRWAQAAHLAQQSEGSPLYVQSLHQSPNNRSRMPDEVRSVFLSELSDLPDDLLDGLSQLAQLHDRFEPKVAEAVWGDPAPRLLREAVRHHLLVPAGSIETVRLPELTHRPSDAEHHLTFASETMRVAVAGRLPAHERQVVRRQLADLLGGETATPLAHTVLPVPLGALSLPVPAPPRPAQIQLLPRAPMLPSMNQPRRELQTANGYRIALEGGLLEVLRRGRRGPAPAVGAYLARNSGACLSLDAGGPHRRVEPFRCRPGCGPSLRLLRAHRYGRPPVLFHCPNA